MTRETSLAVWQQIQDSLPKRRREVFAAVRVWPSSTATELENATGLRHLNKRLSELERLGLVAGVPSTCGVTGHAALRWRVELTPVAKTTPPRPSWKARALRAEAELASLRRSLALAPAEELELMRVGA